MRVLFTLFFLSLVLGQLGGVMVAPNIVLYVHDVVLLVVLGVAALKIVRKKIVRPRLLIPIVSFGGIGIVSLLVNYFQFAPSELFQGSLYLLRWIVYAGLYGVIVQGTVPATFLLSGLFITGTALSFLGFIQYVLYPDLRYLFYLGWDPHYQRLFSTLLDPNFAGILIALTFFLGLYMLTKHRSWIVIAAQAGNLIALYLTYSRGSWLGFVIGLALWIWLEKRWKLLIGLGLFVFLLVVIPRPGGETLRLLRADSTIARIQNWRQTIPLIGTSPIFGHGFNTLRFVQGLDNAGKNIVSRSGAGVDSSLMFLAATTGVTGLAVYGWLLCQMVTTAMSLRSVRSLLLSSIAVVLVHSLFVNSLFYPWVMLWLWILVGSIETMSLLKRPHR